MGIILCGCGDFHNAHNDIENARNDTESALGFLKWGLKSRGTGVDFGLKRVPPSGPTNHLGPRGHRYI